MSQAVAPADIPAITQRRIFFDEKRCVRISVRTRSLIVPSPMVESGEHDRLIEYISHTFRFVVGYLNVTMRHQIFECDCAPLNKVT